MQEVVEKTKQTHEETESERYIKQLLRLNGIGVFLILMYIVEISEVSNYYNIFTILVIFLFSLGFIHSMNGFNPAVWLEKRFIR